MKKLLYLMIFVVGLFSCSLAYDTVAELETYFNQSASTEGVSYYMTDDYYSNIDVINNNLINSTNHLARLEEYDYFLSIPYGQGYALVFYSDYDLRFYFSSVTKNSFLSFYYWSLYNNSDTSVSFVYDYYLVADDYSVTYNSSKSYNLSPNSYYSGTEGVPNITVFRIYNRVVTNARARSLEEFCSLFKSNYDVYYYNTSEVLVSSGNTVELPEMQNPFANSELRSIHERLNDSSVLKDYLPSNYNSYFITYNSETGQYKAFFYPDLQLPYARVYPENYQHGDNAYEYSTYILDIGYEDNYKNKRYDLFFNSSYSFPIYTFVTFGSSSDFWHHSTITSLELSQNINSFNDVPIIFSSKDINLYYVDDEGNIVYSEDSVDEKTVVVLPSTILTDEETGEDVSTDIVVGEKDNTSLWTLINELPGKILEAIKSIFSVKKTSIETISDLIKDKLPAISVARQVIDETISIFENANPEPPQIMVDFTGAKSDINYGEKAVVLDFSWYEPYKETVDAVIIGFVYIVFFWRFFHRIPNILMGSDSLFDYISARSDEQNRVHDIGFGRRGTKK